MSTDVTIELMQLDLPAPVAPATRRCGIVAKFISTARPEMSRPARDLERMRRLPSLGRAEDVAQRDEMALAVRHLDADGRAARDRSEDADVG